MDANGLKDRSSISVGQRLLIPRATQVQSIIPVYNARPWRYIVIHHSATHQGNALSIDGVHYRRGFPNGLGYHFLIDNGTQGKQEGQIEAGPRWIKQMNGAHANAAGMNENGIGICVIGNFSERSVGEKQLGSLVFLVNTLMAHYRIPPERVIRHRDVPGKNTECPGNHFPWAEFKRRLELGR
ncbi:MAG: N-acetylmuramoyl-L-alanine amidase [Candidatus Omnitrophica bacterium]|nr:N-acetylmuramoyl-L-alanine amidase [Candidatus Omnitrophota bacterium]